MKKSKVSENYSENYLEKIPIHSDIKWTKDESGAVTLEIENKGLLNRIFQKILKKPKISYIHLDEAGSLVWTLLDGEKTIYDIGVAVREHLGEGADPLYERIIKFIQILVSYNFVKFK